MLISHWKYSAPLQFLQSLMLLAWPVEANEQIEEIVALVNREWDQ